MRRLAAFMIVPALLLAAACGSDDGESKSDPSASATSPSPAAAPSAKIVDGPLPAVSGEFGEKPKIKTSEERPSKDLAVKVLSEGDGPKVGKADYIQAHYLGAVWKSGKVFDNSYDRGTPLTMQLTGLIPGWVQGLEGKRAGSRVELAIPPALGYGDQGNEQAGIKGDDTLVFVVDILGTFNGKSSATGEVREQSDAALPKAGTNTDGKAPSIQVPKGEAAPKKLVSEAVIEGDGPTVKKDGKILVHYKGVLWKDGKEFDSSWARKTPAEFSLNQVVPGFTEGLEGKKAGSRVLLVIPPDKGYGDKANGPIPANSTLVFAVDILAVM